MVWSWEVQSPKEEIAATLHLSSLGFYSNMENGRLIAGQLQKTPSSWSPPALRLQLSPTCWLIEPHSFNTCNFLTDHCKQPRSLRPTVFLFSLAGAFVCRYLLPTMNSVCFCLLHGLPSFPLLGGVFLFTFLSVLQSVVIWRGMSAANKRNAR